MTTGRRAAAALLMLLVPACAAEPAAVVASPPTTRATDATTPTCDVTPWEDGLPSIDSEATTPADALAAASDGYRRDDLDVGGRRAKIQAYAQMEPVGSAPSGGLPSGAKLFRVPPDRPHAGSIAWVESFDDGDTWTVTGDVVVVAPTCAATTAASAPARPLSTAASCAEAYGEGVATTGLSPATTPEAAVAARATQLRGADGDAPRSEDELAQAHALDAMVLTDQDDDRAVLTVPDGLPHAGATATTGRRDDGWVLTELQVFRPTTGCPNPLPPSPDPAITSGFPPSLVNVLVFGRNPAVVSLQRGDGLDRVTAVHHRTGGTLDVGDEVAIRVTHEPWAGPVLADGQEHLALVLVVDGQPTPVQLVAVFDADGVVAEPGQRPVMGEVDRHLAGGLVDRLVALVDRAVAASQTGTVLEPPQEVDPVAAFLAIPPDQRFLDAADTPQAVQDAYTTTITVAFDLPADLAGTPVGGDVILTLFDPELAVLQQVLVGAGGTVFAFPVLVGEGEVVAILESESTGARREPVPLGRLREVAADLPDGTFLIVRVRGTSFDDLVVELDSGPIE